MNPENTQNYNIPPEYQSWVKKVMATNPSLGLEEAYSKFTAARQKYNWPIDESMSLQTPGEHIISGRNRMLVYKELNLLDPEEEPKLEAVLLEFQTASAQVAEKTGLTQEAARDQIEYCLDRGIADSFAEVKEILLNPPVVIGFEESELDPKIPNNKVKTLLEDTFGADVFERFNIVKVGKDDTFFIYTGRNREATAKASKMKEQGLLKFAGNFYLHQARNREDYEQAEMALEEKNSTTELSHDFKVRAEAGAVGAKGKIIRLKTFCIEQPKDFDYLDTLKMDEADKKRAYILSTLVHEMGHHIAKTFDSETSEEYADIVNTETSTKREKYVTDYVLRHEKLYNSEAEGIMHDDFCESLRIYSANPQYLIDNYPRRHSFIKTRFPWIKENSVVSFLEQKQS